MRAILHIGTEKTGTTTIQSFLQKNRRQLSSAGYHVLQSAGDYSSRALPAICISDKKQDDYFRDHGVTTLEEREVLRDQVINGIDQEIASLRSGIHTVIISSEHFHSRIRTEEEMGNVLRLLSRYFDEFKIICYLREQVTTCSSWYSTGLKAGATGSFAEFMKRCVPQNYYFNYSEMLDNWERHFGTAALDVGLFAEEHFLGRDLLEDFTHRIDPKLVGKLNKSISSENESLTPVGQALARAVNLTFLVGPPDLPSSQVRKKCLNVITERYKGKGQYPSAEKQQRLFEAFAESNEQLRQKYFPGIDTLFHPPRLAAPEPASLADDFAEALYLLLDMFRKELADVVDSQHVVRFCEMAARSIADLEGWEEQASERDYPELSRKDARRLIRAAIEMERLHIGHSAAILKIVKKFHPLMDEVDDLLEQQKNLKKQRRKPRFMLTHSAGRIPEDPEELQRFQENFAVWFRSLPIAQNPSLPTPAGARLIRGGAKPVIEETSSLAFSIIIKADSMDEAVALAEKSPTLQIGGNIQVSSVGKVSKKSAKRSK